MKYRTLISAEQIKTRVQELGREITAHFAKNKKEKLIVLGVLKGSFIFLADLVRELELACEIEFIEVSSYGAGTQSSGTVELLRDIGIPLNAEDVLIVEDIVDTGNTIYYLLQHLQKAHRPHSIKVCTLLHKPSRAEKEVPIDFKGFTIDDHFVVGYGLDFNNRFRELKDIVIYQP